MTGTFTISLDFELHWGGFEKWELPVGNSEFRVPGSEFKVQDSRFKVQGSRAGDVTGMFVNGVRDYGEYFLNTRLVIPEMLRLFADHGAHATWATVGMLFHESREELLKNSPSVKPSYKTRELSAYEYIETKGIGVNEGDDPFHFAPSLVKKILETPHQELGTHTFAHYYCNEAGQTIDQFREDIRAAQRIASKFGVKLRSLVFPRNQFNDRYLKVCFEEGIKVVRSNPLDWFWYIESTQGESRWKRLNRGLDAYFPVGKKNTYPASAVAAREGFPLCLPASRLLRPYNPKESVLNDFKIARIKSEMTRAARQNEVYHLWWHPHNFGKYPEQSLDGLKRILAHYRHCRERYGMESLNMGEVADMLVSRA